MVTWTDFVSAPPWTEWWHFVIGLGIMLLVWTVFRRSPFAPLLSVLAVTAVLFKEFYVDIILEGASNTSGAVDAIWFFIGFVAGAVSGASVPQGFIVALLSFVAVTVLLFLGVV